MFKFLNWYTNGNITDWDDIKTLIIVLGVLALFILIFVLAIHGEGIPTTDGPCTYAGSPC